MRLLPVLRPLQYLLLLFPYQKISVLYSRNSVLRQIVRTLESVAFVKVFSLNSFSIVLPMPCTMVLNATSVTASSDSVYC